MNIEDSDVLELKDPKATLSTLLAESVDHAKSISELHAIMKNAALEDGTEDGLQLRDKKTRNGFVTDEEYESYERGYKDGFDRSPNRKQPTPEAGVAAGEAAELPAGAEPRGDGGVPVVQS